MNPRCLLTCWKDGQCEMFFAIISKLYDPTTFSDSKASKGICYSRWLFKQDWTLTINQVTASSIHSSQFYAENSIDGIFLQGNVFIYHSYDHEENSHLLVELKEVKMIETILVMPRSSNTEFQDILIEVGQTMDTLKEFASYGSTVAEGNQVLEFNQRKVHQNQEIQILFGHSRSCYSGVMVHNSIRAILLCAATMLCEFFRFAIRLNLQ